MIGIPDLIKFKCNKCGREHYTYMNVIVKKHKNCGGEFIKVR